MLSVTGTLASTIGQSNPYRYRGYWFDSETGFYYLQSRYYDPQMGRFINADDEDLIDTTIEDLTDKNYYASTFRNDIYSEIY